MTDSEFSEWLARDVERRKWSEGALERIRALQARERDIDEAIKARDAAFAERDKILKDLETKKKRHERDMQATLADLERITMEHASRNQQAKAQAESELNWLKAQTVDADIEDALRAGCDARP